MKKIIPLILIFAILICTVVFAGAIDTAENNSIKIGTEDIEFENNIYNIDNKIYVPVRELFEKLCIPVAWNEVQDQAEILIDYKTIYTSKETELKEEGVIPDEQTAHEIGKIILEKYAGETMEYETEEKTYFLHVYFQEESNSWIVSQTYKFKNKGGGFSGLSVPYVVLNKNTGEVKSINTYSQIKE